MERRFTTAFATLACISVLTIPAAPVLAQDVETFVPDSDWALDYGEDACRLIRDFSDGNDKVTLLIERSAPGQTLRVMVYGNVLKPFRGAEQIGYAMLPQGVSRNAPKVQLAEINGQLGLNLGTTTLADPPARGGVGGAGARPAGAPSVPAQSSREAEARTAASINGIALTTGLSRPVHIETGPLGAPIEALQVCADDLAGSWGIDAEAHKSLTRAASPAVPPAGWVEQGTVGFGDFARLSGGNNEFRVMIDAAGKPTACAVQSPSLDKATNDRICGAVMSKGAFNPALDAAGKPIASYWTTSVVFLMPALRR